MKDGGDDVVILEAQNQSNKCTLSISGPPILTNFSVGSVVSSVAEITLQDKEPVFFQLREEQHDTPRRRRSGCTKSMVDPPILQ
jgi:hypothetical protein